MSDNKDILNDILNSTNNGIPENNDIPEQSPIEEIPEDPYYDPRNDAPEEVEQSAEEEQYEEEYEDDFPDEEEFIPQRRRQGQPPRKKKKKKKKRQMSRLPFVLILVTLIFGISIISSLMIIALGKDMLGIDKSEKTHLLVVPDGATVEQIAEMLVSDEIIKYQKPFVTFANLRQEGMVFVSGEHFVRPNMPYETIIDELTKVPTEEMGESIQVTFPEGINLIEAANILESEGICKAKDFIFYFNSGGFGVPFEENLPTDTSMKFERMEGYLFPDTYFFYQNSSPEEVCQKIYYNFDTRLNSTYTYNGKQMTRYDRMKQLNLTLDQLITLASIVQKEAATNDTMTLVASVFWNRIEDPENFKKLESDPTSNYADQVIRPNMEYFDAVKADAYDTYKSPGLPPGAICNPGLSAIDAVLEKYESDPLYYYFIANLMTGETEFSETLDEHEAKREVIEQYYRDHPIEEDDE